MEAGSLEGGDIIYERNSKIFELQLEWKISDGGNSGIFYLAQELPDKTIWQTAPEMQVLDNLKHPDDAMACTAHGCFVHLIGVAADRGRKPVGEWNQVKILIYKRTC